MIRSIPFYVARFLVFVLLGTLSAVELQSAEPRQAAELIEFERDIAPLLSSRCLSCHEGEEAKNGFLIGDRDQVLGYVTPGEAHNSSLWTDYLNQPSKKTSTDSLVMPPDGPLSLGELLMLKQWIDEGAKWPEGFKVLPPGRAMAAMDNKSTEARPAWLRLFLASGYFHPAVIHFPIALFAVAGGCAFFSYFLGKRCESMAFHLLWIGVLSSFLTVVMGWAFADLQGYPAWNKPLSDHPSHQESTFFGHRWLGTSVCIVGLIVLICSFCAAKSSTRWLTHTWLVGTMLLALLVGIVGHQGGELKYGDIFEKAWEKWKEN